MGLSYQITHNRIVMNQERTLTFGNIREHIEVILLEASQQVTSVV